MPALYEQTAGQRKADPCGKLRSPIPQVPHPGNNTSGKEIELKVNIYPISGFPTRPVYQYDIAIGNGDEKRGVIKKVWASDARKAKLRQMIFDGNRLAWSMNEYPPISIMVDLDAGKTKKSKQPNVFQLKCRLVKKLDLGVIQAFYSDRPNKPHQDVVLEAFSFLDHLIREYPSQKFTAINRSFYDEKTPTVDLGAGVMCMKGMYQAIRWVEPARIAINVHVSNTAFWSRISILGIAKYLLFVQDTPSLMNLFKPKSINPRVESEQYRRVEKFIQGLPIQAKYPGCPVDKPFQIKGLFSNAYHKIPCNPGNWHDRSEKQMITINDYFRLRYNVTLQFPQLPLLEMQSKGVYLPMEITFVHGLQRYPWKLDENQTSKMIEIAANRPADRLRDIEANKQALDHKHDPILKLFGLEVADQMVKTKGRLLPSPDIQFGNTKHSPGTSGRWDLRGKKFLRPNRAALASWGVGFFPGKRNAINRTQVEGFTEMFSKQYTGHGGLVERRPHIMELKEDVAEAIKNLYQATGNKFNKMPQLLLIIVPNKDPFFYLRIKKSCDCRWGVQSQVLQSAHVIKNFPQYSSNVAMKVNAKLGGTTSRVLPRIPDASLRPGSVIIGADVSHASPGSWAPSLTAMSCSMDSWGSKYMGTCETGVARAEMISFHNLRDMLIPMFREWITVVGQGRAPLNVYYFRDGVSTGQFKKVLDEEVSVIRTVLTELIKEEWKGKICVVVAVKRHHIRAFPRPDDRNAADKNGNPLPGTLIQKDVIEPASWDFLLYSHIALQGTSRPVYYHVIKDEIGHKANQLQNMIYDHCYQYMRSTTSVSLFPAVYYAHLISNRARHHENVPSSAGPQSGPETKLGTPKPEGHSEIPPKLLQMVANSNKLPLDMWYI